MTTEHLGDNATAADLAWFRLACACRQGETGEDDDDDAVTDWMWGRGDWPERAQQYADPALVDGEWIEVTD